MRRPRSADDFAAIRARLEELRRERMQSSADTNPRSVIEPPLYSEDSDRAPSRRPGVPGWRVTFRKRMSSS
jgi:hypothetical protein